MKADLGTYQQYDAFAAANPMTIGGCKAWVGFEIQSIKLSLTTQTDISVTGTVGVTVPVGAVTIGPSAGFTSETKGTQTITFSLYPKKLDATPTDSPPIDAQTMPIAAALKQLREGLLQASNVQPCVSLVPPPDSKGQPAKDDGGTFVFGFSVSKQHSGGGKLSFLIFSLGATNSAQTQAGNTITVAFKARPNSVSFQ